MREFNSQQNKNTHPSNKSIAEFSKTGGTGSADII